MKFHWRNLFGVATLAIGLMGLGTGCSFDEFVDQSYQMILERNPELHAMTDPNQPPPSELDDVSDAYLLQTYELVEAIHQKLTEFDFDSLTPEQQVTYEVYEKVLSDDLAGREFRLNNLWYHSELRLGGDPSYYFWRIPLETYQDAQRFARDLRKLKTRIGQVRDNFAAAVAAELVPARAIVESQQYYWEFACGQYEPGGDPVAYEDLLAYKIEQAGLVLTVEQRAELDELMDESIQIIKATCGELHAVLAGAADQSPADEAGIWVMSNGEAYYQHRLTFHNGTDQPPAQLHQLGIEKTAEIHQQIRQLLEPLGYPPDMAFADLMDLLNADCPRLNRDELTEYMETVVADAQANLSQVINLVPTTELVLEYMDGVAGGYLPAPLDGSGPGVFLFGVPYGEEDVSSIAVRSLAYHEAVPGHHVQVSLAQELEVSLLRQISFFTPHAEGWALYSERLAGELDWYAGDVCGHVGQLLSEAFRAVRLTVDTGLHAFEWTAEDGIEYMSANLGNHMGTITIPGQVYRYLHNPAQATGYYIGMHRLLILRQQAREALGDDFDLAEFNDLAVSSGHIPLSTLERLVGEYIATKQ